MKIRLKDSPREVREVMPIDVQRFVADKFYAWRTVGPNTVTYFSVNDWEPVPLDRIGEPRKTPSEHWAILSAESVVVSHGSALRFSPHEVVCLPPKVFAQAHIDGSVRFGFYQCHYHAIEHGAVRPSVVQGSIRLTGETNAFAYTDIPLPTDVRAIPDQQGGVWFQKKVVL